MRGFTLLEVLLTLVLILSGFLALSHNLTVGLTAGGQNESLVLATQLAQEKVEEIRNKSFTNVTSEARAAISGFSSYDREVVVTTPETGLKQAAVNVYWFDKASESNLTLVTYVADPS